MVTIQNETALFAIINLFCQKSSLPVFIIIQLMTFHDNPWNKALFLIHPCLPNVSHY